MYNSKFLNSLFIMTKSNQIRVWHILWKQLIVSPKSVSCPFSMNTANWKRSWSSLFYLSFHRQTSLKILAFKVTNVSVNYLTHANNCHCNSQRKGRKSRSCSRICYNFKVWSWRFPFNFCFGLSFSFFFFYLCFITRCHYWLWF